MDVLLRVATDQDFSECFIPELGPASEARLRRGLATPDVTIRTIAADRQPVGYIASFKREGQPEISYWIARRHWGQGIATRALEQFLDEIRTRPLYARAASENTRSLRVLRKCGFSVTGKGTFATENGQVIDEYIFALGVGSATPSPILRPATLADAHSISRLLNQLSYTYLRAPTPAQALAFLETISEPAIRALLARTDVDYVVAEAPAIGGLAGAAGMQAGGQLLHLFIHPAYQGHGWGRRLWQTLKEHAIGSGHAGAFTVYSSLNAVPIYQRFGFAVSGARIETNGGVAVPMICAPPAP
jgi:RimJ/RimL family protein N-acetyltransferase